MLRTGKGTNTSAVRFWGMSRYVWNNPGDEAIVRDPAGATMDTCAWTTLEAGTSAARSREAKLAGRGSSGGRRGSGVGLGGVHVLAASAALSIGLLVLVRPKGGRRHVVLGRAYASAMVAVNVPALLLDEGGGRPGPFHLLAVVSLVTTGFGWSAARRRTSRGGATTVHATLMTWSWVGVAAAGLAQLANRVWPERSPWPVLVVVGASTALGLLLVPRFVARQRRRGAQRWSSRTHGPAASGPGRG